MTLSIHDYRLFVLTHLGLLLYTGLRKKIVPARMDFDRFHNNTDMETKAKCRNKLYEDMSLLDDYLSDFSENLTADQVNILEGFKKKIKSRFIIFRCLSRYAIFMDTNDNTFYAVHPLADRFENFFLRFPAYCEAVILPFKDMIIYDGFIKIMNLYAGPNITRSMNEDYKEAKRKKEIITRLG